MRRPRRSHFRRRRRDRLTGLATPWRFHPYLQRKLRRRPVSLALFNIDDLKALMDSYGIPAGDAVMRQLGDEIAGETLGNGFRSTAFRISGTELALVLADVDIDQAVEAAERVRARYDRDTVSVSYLPEPLREFTVSAGVSRGARAQDKDDAAAAATRMVASAQLALHDAKRQGRNRVVAA